MFQRSRIPFGQMLVEGGLPSRVQRRRYRSRGYRIAAGVELGPGVVIDADEVDIAEGATFGPGVVIRGRRVRIGRRAHVAAFCIFEGGDIELDDDAVVREQVFVGGPLLPDSLLSVGKRVKVFQTCFLNPSRPLRIGDDTGVGGRSSIFTHGSWQSALEGYPVAFEPVTIGRNVWLPWHVFILPGVEIGDGATIGAGSVVNRSIPAGALAAGVPAKVLKPAEEWPRRLDAEEQWRLAQSIVEQLFDHLRANGVTVDQRRDEGRVEATVSHGGLRRTVALVDTGAHARPGDEVLLQLHGTPSTGGGIAWFALLEKHKRAARDDLAAEVEDFLGRYGIRFAPVDEL